MFRWTDESIRFREEAAEYNKFEEKLADELKKLIKPGYDICDVGCGLGFLSIELAKRGFNVTAVDTDTKAIAVLKKNLEKQHLCDKVTVKNADIFCCSDDKKYDVMIFSFFGNSQEILSIMKKYCKGFGIIITKDWDTHRFTLNTEKLEKNPFRNMCDQLDKKEIQYKAQTHLMDTGQPFLSLSDAEIFYSLYGKNSSINMSRIKDKVVAVNSEKYKYYIPCERKIGIILVENDLKTAND